MLPHLAIRRATAHPADYLAVAAFHRLTGETATPDDLLAFDRTCERSGAHSWRYLAQDHAGTTLGVAHFFPVTWRKEPGTYWIAARVRRDYERQGIGSALLAQMEADLGVLGARAMWLMVPEEQPEIMAALQRRGFREQMRSHPFTLEVAQAPSLQLEARLERLATHGLRVRTLADCRAEDPDWLERIYALHAAITREVPIPEKIFVTREEFAAFAVEAPDALLDAFFVVCAGTEYVGLSFMQRRAANPGTLYQELTGTLPAYRGLGLAHTLKELTIDYALRHGYQRIVTWVEDTNSGMVAINQRYAFVREAGLVLLERPVAPAVMLEPAQVQVAAR
ncbi:GNAT family N-acetyltransferase [Candidatus Viridilinea mediisalina]|nr:GNAT family N-acetyltransferase [Candidatus Viridilinea mediisalina]